MLRQLTCVFTEHVGRFCLWEHAFSTALKNSTWTFAHNMAQSALLLVLPLSLTRKTLNVTSPNWQQWRQQKDWWWMGRNVTWKICTKKQLHGLDGEGSAEVIILSTQEKKERHWQWRVSPFKTANAFFRWVINLSPQYSDKRASLNWHSGARRLTLGEKHQRWHLCAYGCSKYNKNLKHKLV